MLQRAFNFAFAFSNQMIFAFGSTKINMFRLASSVKHENERHVEKYILYNIHPIDTEHGLYHTIKNDVIINNDIMAQIKSLIWFH